MPLVAVLLLAGLVVLDTGLVVGLIDVVGSEAA